MNANIGHAAADVLYVAFKGQVAVPGAKGADWAASSFQEFEASIQKLGEKLVSQISVNSSNGTTSTSAAGMRAVGGISGSMGIVALVLAVAAAMNWL